MTAATAPTQPKTPDPTPAGPVFPDVLRSEWTKLRSVRSGYWTLLATVVVLVGFSALVAASTVAGYSEMTLQDKADLSPITIGLSGVDFAQIAILVLGVLVITSEYGSGMIRSSVSAVPQRLTLLAAKAALLASITTVVGIVSCFAAFFIAQSILSGEGIQAHIGDPGALRSVVGGGLYLGVVSLLALGVGTLIRRSAGAIAAVFGLLFVLPLLLGLLPARWAEGIGKYLPGLAGQALFGVPRGTSPLSPWVGFGVFCLWAAAALLAGAMALQRRDA